MKHPVIAVLLLAACFAAGAVESSGEEPAEAFVPRLEAGDAFDRTEKCQVDLLVGAAGEREREPFAVTFEQEEVSKTRVLSAADGRPSEIERTFEKSLRARGGTVLGGRNEQKNFVDGKTFLVTRAVDGDGIRQTKPEAGEEAPVPPDAQAVLTEDLDLPFLALFPDRPVPPGQSWTPAGSSVKSLLPVSARKSFREGAATVRFAGVTVSGGRRCARLEVSGMRVVLREEQGGATLTFDLSGTLLFALDKGMLVSAALKGGVKMACEATGMTGEGTASFAREVRFLGE